MVLESVVADLLNRFLGDYVENLNKSQLKLGIWGGKRGGGGGREDGRGFCGGAPCSRLSLPPSPPPRGSGSPASLPSPRCTREQRSPAELPATR